MTDRVPYEDEAAKTLEAIGRLGRSRAPARFADEVMRRLPPGGVPRRRRLAPGVGLVIAGLAALAALNAAALIGLRARTAASARDEAIDSVAVEYDLTARSLRTWE